MAGGILLSKNNKTRVSSRKAVIFMPEGDKLPGDTGKPMDRDT